LGIDDELTVDIGNVERRLLIGGPLPTEADKVVAARGGGDRAGEGAVDAHRAPKAEGPGRVTAIERHASPVQDQIAQGVELVVRGHVAAGVDRHGYGAGGGGTSPSVGRAHAQSSPVVDHHGVKRADSAVGAAQSSSVDRDTAGKIVVIFRQGERAGPALDQAPRTGDLPREGLVACLHHRQIHPTRQTHIAAVGSPAPQGSDRLAHLHRQ